MNWEQRPLKDIGQWIGGGTPSKSRPEFWNNGSIPWLSPKDMGPPVLADTEDHITPAAVAGSPVRPVPANSVAIVVRSGILERTLPVAIVPFETTLNQDMKAVTPNHDVDARWIAWGLRAFETQLLRTTRKTGTTVASIEMPRLYKFELPVPSLTEQRRIVETLEDQLSRVSAAQQAAANASRRVANMWQSALHNEITGPKVRLAELATDARYGTSTKCTASGEGLPVVRIPNLVAGGIDLSDQKRAEDTTVDLTNLLLKKGDILIVRTNGSKDLIGRSAVVDGDWTAAFASYLIRYRVNLSRVIPLWVHFALQTPQVRATIEQMAASSAGQHNLGLKKLDSLLLPCPSIEFQSDKLLRLQEIADAGAQLTSAIAAAQKGATALRQAVLTAAFSGKLTGRHTDQEVIEELTDARDGYSEPLVTA
ncbi:restriction endonuclease subunit S [Pseudarthrobacter sp. NPDC055928]|uniref:restriction endonuclease subunit S n=1 Tax=Pseudarthrobacter sp. NPDC055928 TaxID=3345661 RepID=UPI0035D72430